MSSFVGDGTVAPPRSVCSWPESLENRRRGTGCLGGIGLAAAAEDFSWRELRGLAR